ncbi:ChaN family lipoprotein [Roseisalinus antarcticus]|uniref:Haem-binding uptake Tiki superfamily ChaN domain-containing protein n=1 Tax=Roseisalinus antarcticus TaxID=254357 RepID=A0A1Y5SI18_9RHOB|nr:ChaN family lipoprotein [Roseisalinus antarcticus]SLN38310.1 hypothetical protein ROA7023_01474 [Roseisalinus antarcticus]
MIRLLLIALWAAPAAAQDVFVLGEVHDNPAHHLIQAERVAEIAPAALVFEMLSPARADAGRGVDWADPVALENALGWDDSPWPDFTMYYPIFAAAPPGTALYGGAVPREALIRAMEEGPEAVVAAPDLLRPVSAEEQAVREAGQAEAHCGALPEGMLPGMVAAQILRDAAFAAAVLTALDETGGPVVLITGNGHARTDWGVPAVLRSARPGIGVFALGQMEGSAEPGLPYDAVVMSEAVEREDPCDVFR